ncbi:OmpA family protein [Curvibacter sp. HBC28]|uniref:OmpA family protein n=1 Tax=Curvibacter microcysteis TaxID=3026419 RepID=A0ABT5ML00_9BURK|nr:OmpA family protein [Curvibacter sp. HBC28]MDD0817060.1 OmpA family protein [Curvibacter sp. HBC28]
MPTLSFVRRAAARLAAPLLCASLLACQSPPPAAPAPAPAAVAPYSGPTLPIAQSDRGVQIFLPSAALFELGQSTLNPTESGPYLQRISTLLMTKTERPVVLEGHTDNTGSATTNQALSEARAQTVRNALQALGVPAQRLSTVGYSFKRPVASNATEEGRRLNRRVEVLILDEKVEQITRGEAPNAFESAWEQLKSLMDRGLVRPATGA